MMRRLGASVTLCCVLTGEAGRVVRGLLEDEGFDVAAVERTGRGGLSEVYLGQGVRVLRDLNLEIISLCRGGCSSALTAWCR